MVEPADVERILSDVARLVGEGEVIVFGSAALALRMDRPPSTRDVDLWCVPVEKGEIVTALMGELSWYHERNGVFVEVWGPETFAAPAGWRQRAVERSLAQNPRVRLVVPHPHDVLVSKLERFEERDREHAATILDEYPLRLDELDALIAAAPHRRGQVEDPERRARFEHGAARLRALVGRAD
jgi:hypothetical protein